MLSYDTVVYSVQYYIQTWGYCILPCLISSL